MRINDCSIAPNGSRLAAITSDNRVLVFDFQTRVKIADWYMEDKLTCVTLSHDGNTVLISMNEGRLMLLDSETGDIVQRYAGLKQSEFVIRSAFGGANENFVISGSEGEFLFLSFSSCRSPNIHHTDLLQTPVFISGERKRVNKSQPSKHIILGLSTASPGIRPTLPFSPLPAMITESKCMYHKSKTLTSCTMDLLTWHRWSNTHTIRRSSTLGFGRSLGDNGFSR